MEAFADLNGDYGDLLQQLKNIWDPADVLAPGRYGLK
jgi:hypothetical protein